MSPLKPVVALVALLASFALAPLAGAETVVPPGNSAATQYTEAFPTSGGNAKSNSGIDGDASPQKVLGSGNAKKLESKGQVGHEVADLAAETAPAPVVSETNQSDKPSGRHPATGGGKANGGGSSQGGSANTTGGAGTVQAEPRPIEAGAGSSGFGEVLSQATGSSSGQLGLFLPLIILGTVIWSLNYLWRQRRQVG